jgi:hypothetical protein
MFKATSVQDGQSTVYLQSVSALPQYQDQSLEELRFAYYSKRYRSLESFGTGSSATTARCRVCGNCSAVAGVVDFTSSTQVAVPGPIAPFRTNPFAATPLWQPVQPFAPFSTTALSALYSGMYDTPSTPYQSTTRQDGATTIHLQSISAMPSYQNQSHEELRFQDYKLRNDEAGPKICCSRGNGQQSEVGTILGEPVPVARSLRQKGADDTPNYPPKQFAHWASNLFDTSTKSAPSLIATRLFEGSPSLNTARPSNKGYNRCHERRFRLRRQNRTRARIQQRRDVLPLPATGTDSTSRDLRSARISISTFTRGTQAEGPAYERYLQVIENDASKSQSFLPKLTKKGYELSPTIEMLSEANLSSVAKVSIRRPGFEKKLNGKIPLICAAPT